MKTNAIARRLPERLFTISILSLKGNQTKLSLGSDGKKPNSHFLGPDNFLVQFT